MPMRFGPPENSCGYRDMADSSILRHAVDPHALAARIAVHHLAMKNQRLGDHVLDPVAGIERANGS